MSHNKVQGLEYLEDTDLLPKVLFYAKSHKEKGNFSFR